MTSIHEQQAIAENVISRIGELLLVQNPGSLVVNSFGDDHIKLSTCSDEEPILERVGLNDQTSLPIAVNMDVEHFEDTGLTRGVIRVLQPQTILELVEHNTNKHHLTLTIESTNRGNDQLPSLTQYDTERQFYINVETYPESPDPFAAAAELLDSILARGYAEATGLTLEDMEGVRDYHRNPAFNKTLSLLDVFQLTQQD